jgi:3'-phosphoadenosine 5'-phosphosulfate sulfotransferase (PAPS reductase)/FAD synthetase
MNKGISYPKCYALVSGGKDSLSAAQVLHEAGKLEACVALETGVSTPDWKDFVVKTCAERGWPLEFYPTGESYDELVLEYGFPGPSKHKKFMDRLKGRGIAKFKKAHPKGILASGTRAKESVRRGANSSPVGMWERVPIVAPIYDWTTDETWAFFRDRGFERAPGYSTLQISGDCLCGAFAREGECDAVKFHYPEVGARFDALSAQMRGRIPKERCEWGWGWKKPLKEKQRDENLVCSECGPRSLFDDAEFQELL